MKRTFLTLLLVGIATAGCTTESHAAGAAKSAPSANSNANTAVASQRELDPMRVVATVDGHSVTAKDVDTLIGPQLGELKDKFQAEQVDLRKQGLDAVVVMRLVDAEAKKEGTTEQLWLKKHVEDATPEATEADAKKFFDENTAQMAGQTFEKAKPQIIAFLTNHKRRDAAEKVFDGLKSKAKIEITL